MRATYPLQNAHATRTVIVANARDRGKERESNTQFGFRSSDSCISSKLNEIPFATTALLFRTYARHEGETRRTSIHVYPLEASRSRDIPMFPSVANSKCNGYPLSLSSPLLIPVIQRAHRKHDDSTPFLSLTGTHHRRRRTSGDSRARTLLRTRHPRGRTRKRDAINKQ